MTGKVVMVVGAGASGPGWGNGKAAAVLYAREGARVFAIDRNGDAARETCAIVRGEGGEAEPFAADAARAGDVAAMVDACIARFGLPDVLHHNVGIVMTGGPAETAEADWDRLMAVNVKSLYLACRALLPGMAERGSGVVVAVSSVASLRYVGYPSVAYCASKGAVNQLVQNIAVQYAARGIRANAVLPGLMDTPMVVEPLKEAYGPGGVEQMRAVRNAQVPTGRMGSAWDVAHAALFLASDEAAYVNGHMLVVDGGLTAKFA